MRTAAAVVDEQAQRMLLAAYARCGQSFMPVSQEDRLQQHRQPVARMLSRLLLRALCVSLVAVALIGGMLVWHRQLQRGSTEDSKLPHILLIEADQVRPDAHAVGNPVGLAAVTPNIDSIALEGVRFARAYSSTPICTPARLAILTGRSPMRHGMRSYFSRVPAPGAMLELVTTMASNGYYTCVVGKNHYGVDVHGHFESHGYAESHIYEGLLDYDSRTDGRFVRLDDYGAWFNRSCSGCDPLATMARGGSSASAAPWRQVAGATPYNSNEAFVYPHREELHPTRWTADVAIWSFERWLIRRRLDDSRPLFLKVSFHRPHSPLDPPERWMRYMLDRSYRIAEPAIGEWSKELFSGQTEEEDEDHQCTAASRRYCGPSCGFQSYCGRLARSETRRVRAAYLASLSFVDEQAGRLLNRLKSSNVWSNTLILYLSDHGDALGDHDLWRKGYPYEQVASVPFYLRWPSAWDAKVGLNRGTVLNHLVELRDVFPTIADVAGIELPSSEATDAPDGRSVLPLMQQGITSSAWRDVLVLELAMCSFKAMENWVAITDGKTKYIRRLFDGVEQLFDLSNDPYEKRDLIDANLSAVDYWRERLAAEFMREGRGPQWVTQDGALPLASRCADYERLGPAGDSGVLDSKDRGAPMDRVHDTQQVSETSTAAAPLSNVIFFLSDDQDLVLGGAGAPPMHKTHELLVERGTTATNFFAHTPICGPSRAQILTGRYLHNLKWDPTAPKPRPSTERNCMHINTSLVHDHTFAPHLRSAGYTVGLFGKYLNWPADWKHVPDGFDAWFANGGGDYLAPRFFSKNLEFLGYRDGNWQGAADDYSTSVIGNVSVAWIESVSTGARPFFAYIGVKAAHEPFTPAPWYAEYWDDTWPRHEPRTPNWNCSHESRSLHHGCIASAPMLTHTASSVITGAFKNRWRTLLSLDDLVAAAYAVCERAGVVQHTYFISTSDHGYQLGQFNILMDKRHVYDWDTRVPFVIRGPGIPAGYQIEQPATLVDLAPTFLSIAGIAKPASMDGKSILPLLVDETNTDLWAELSQAAQNYLRRMGTGRRAASNWRTAVLLAHYYYSDNSKCVSNCSACSSACTRHDSNCASPSTGSTCWATFGATWAQDPLDCTQECYLTESRQNNFRALRRTTHGAERLYAEFQYGDLDDKPIDFSRPSHFEFFDATADPWMMKNLHASGAELANEEQALREELHAYILCKGDACP